MIKGVEVYIRPITYEDTELIVKWRNQDNVKKYFFYREEFTSDIHEKWMRDKVETGEVVQFVVCLKENDVPVGSTYLRDIDTYNKTAEYGVFLGEENIRGMGVGKRVLMLTLDYAFNELGLEKIISRAITSNKPSVYSFLNSGFVVDEEVADVPCSDGEKVPMTMMSITKDKYMGR